MIYLLVIQVSTFVKYFLKIKKKLIRYKDQFYVDSFTKSLIKLEWFSVKNVKFLSTLYIHKFILNIIFWRDEKIKIAFFFWHESLLLRIKYQVVSHDM